MKVRREPPLHLTYCLNIHPGETWAENLRAVREHAVRVRDAVAPGRAFGLGLRLSRVAAEELAQPARLREFRELLAAEDLYVFTINGFPYGPFHGRAVKQDVYRPDWRSPERRDYTLRLLEVLAGLLPEGVCGSISTVPGGYREHAGAPGDTEAMARMLAQVAVGANAVRERTGRDICIALEPEPDCLIETTGEARRFVTETLAAHGGPVVADATGLPADAAGELLARHVGVCLDTAHAAVRFEDPADALTSLTDAGVRVAKVQLSAALRADATDEAMAALAVFSEPVYLHQVSARRADGRIETFPDLGEALDAAAGRDYDELRVHFHVPLFFTRTGGLGSTADLLGEAFWRTVTDTSPPPTEQMEIETYTFDVLPEPLRCDDVAESIRGEYEWVLEKLAGMVD